MIMGGGRLELSPDDWIVAVVQECDNLPPINFRIKLPKFSSKLGFTVLITGPFTGEFLFAVSGPAFQVVEMTIILS